MFITIQSNIPIIGKRLAMGWIPKMIPSQAEAQKTIKNDILKISKKESEEILLKVWLNNSSQRQVAFENTVRTLPLANKETYYVWLDDVKALKVTGDPPQGASVPIDEKNRCNNWIYQILSLINKKYLCLSNRKAIAIFSKGEYIYILQTEGIDLKTFDAMLSSFRFLD